MPPGLQDKFLGAIVGTAVGDALGAPFEGCSRRTLLGLSGVGETYRSIYNYPLGQYTDDTQLTLVIAESIIECRKVDGANIAKRLAGLWQTGEIVGAGASCAEAAGNILRGVHWQVAGTAIGHAGNGAAMRVSPVGLWHYNNPADILKRDAVKSGIITHKDARATAGAVVIAFCVAYATLQKQLDANDLISRLADLTGDLSPEFSGYIRHLSTWLNMPEEEARFEIAAAGWRKAEAKLDFISPFVMPTVLICLYYFLKNPADFCGNIKKVILAGGDVDTTAAITGALSGAYAGIGAIPKTLVAGVLNSQYIRQVARKLWLTKQAYDRDSIC